MNTEQENFDDLLKSKLEEGNFAFNELNWEKAEALIIAADKKRKRKRIAFIFFIGLILGIGVMIPFIIKNNNDFIIENKIEHEANNKMLSGVNIIKIESNNKAKNTKTGENKLVQKDVIENLGTDVNNERQTNNILSDKKREIKSEKDHEKVLENSLNAEKKNSSSSEIIPLNTEKSNITKIDKLKKKKIKKGEIVNSSKQLSTINKAKAEDKIIVSDDSKTDIQQNNISQKEDTPGVLTVTENNLTKDTAIALKDSVVKTNIDSIKSIAKDSSVKMKQKFILGVDAGTNYTLGWKNSITKEAAGFNGVFGLSATYFIIKKWSVMLGFQYNSLAHLSYGNYTRTSTQYDFGYNQTKTIITPTILYYLAIPVKLQYHFNDKNSLSVGMNVLYLLNTNSKVETNTGSDFGPATSVFTTKYGYRDGFATWDLQPALAYRRKIYRAFSINAEIYYGLIDLKNNNVFGVNKAEHNSGLKITLSYNILYK